MDVDTRSAIYSLGVFRYELLTGRTPFSNEALLRAGLDQVLRIIREKEPQAFDRVGHACLPARTRIPSALPTKPGGPIEPFRSMTQPERSSRMAVLLFTDMVDSTELQRRLGTAVFSRLLQLHDQLLQQALTEAGGQKRNDTGDGILCEFETAAGAVTAALVFQMRLREARWEVEAPRVRIGIHLGQIAENRSDETSPGKLVGLPLNVAARVMSLAQAGQILLTRPVYDDARQFIREHPASPTRKSTRPEVSWKNHGFYKAKGREDPVEVFEVGAAGYAPFTPPPDAEKIQRSQVNPPPPPPSKWSPLIGLALAVICGLLLWGTPLGEAWEDASYDSLFHFATRQLPKKSEQVALVLMDNASYNILSQKRDEPWKRDLHARLLNKLAGAGAKLVVFDINFEKESDPPSNDAKLVAAMGRTRVVLMAELQRTNITLRGTNGTLTLRNRELIPPHETFQRAAAGWGFGCAGVPLLGTPRKHWPFPPSKDDDLISLPFAAATNCRPVAISPVGKRWLRYYGNDANEETAITGWRGVSYHVALTNDPSLFSGKVVFVGSDPVASHKPSLEEEDKFCTPFTRRDDTAVGGVQIMATTFLNLVNGDWLRRLPGWLEALVLVGTGGGLIVGLRRARVWRVWLIAIGALVVVWVLGVCSAFYTNYWFPWLVIAFGQLPVALIWTLSTSRRQYAVPTPLLSTPPAEQPVPKPAAALAISDRPETTDYQLFDPPIGEGGFGKVWLARNAIGQWQALKAIYRAKFGKEQGPYDSEFRGIQKYKPISMRHPGLLGVDFVSMQKPEGYFYYVMELGDSRVPGWQENPTLYRTRDLTSVCAAAKDSRLAPLTCLRMVLPLAEALDFLHRQGLTHRDIKPSNVIFVNDQPKLADVGLVTDIRSPSKIHTWAGTAGYMPPMPNEPPGTVRADIYALGMLLYVISTGNEPGNFPALPADLVRTGTEADFMRLNAIVGKACHPDPTMRFASAAEMRDALREAGRNFTPTNVE